MPSSSPLKHVVIRPWADFLDANLFSLPNDAEFSERIQTNLLYYQGNYFLLIFLLLLTVVWSRPFFLLCLLLNVMAFILVFAGSPPPSPLSSEPLTLMLQFSVASVMFLLLFGGPRALVALLCAALLISIHSVLHCVTSTSRAAARLQLVSQRTPVAQLIQRLAENDRRTAAAVALHGMDDPPPPYQRYPPAYDAFPPLRDRRDSDSEGDGDPHSIRAKYREWKREWRERMARRRS